MKRFSDQNYYEILDISPHASWDEIQRAYEFSKKTYGQDAIASYSLFDSGDREILFERIEEAYRTLIDQAKRRRYDEDLARGIRPIASIDKETVRVSPIPQDILALEEIDGTILKQIRGRRGISLQEIADKTRINIVYLNYIEEDSYPSLPAEVYLKGYLKQYAEALPCDVAWLVSGYLKSYHRWHRQQPEKI
jgi:curved DNA-binding protein CbpA